jgi:heat shock protein HtpX
MAVAVVLPLVVGVALLVAIDWVWLLVAGVCLIGAAAAVVGTAAEDDRYTFFRSAETAGTLLQRLCIRADMPVPELVVEYHWRANAWTAGGRIHITDVLLELLDERELEAVLAHEVAHLARRDAAVMEICSAPSRVLLGFTSLVFPRVFSFTRGLLGFAPPGILIGMLFLVALTVPPAFVLGWISRISVLGLSRAREHSADAAAVTLTGSPSALASALLKLDGQKAWTPRRDLREAEMLCIVGAARTRLGRVLSTHPSTAARVKRLEALEIRIQAGPYRAGAAGSAATP